MAIIGTNCKIEWEKVVIPPEEVKVNHSLPVSLKDMQEMSLTAHYEPLSLQTMQDFLFPPGSIQVEEQTVDEETGETEITLRVDPQQVDVTIDGMPYTDFVEKHRADQIDEIKRQMKGDKG